MTDFITARFRRAFARLDQLEGGWSNKPNDRGKETYRGISRKWFPDWLGWQIIDAAKGRPSFPGNLEGDAELADLVLGFYLAEFWLRVRADDIADEGVAAALFLFSVNAGRFEAAMALQVALNGLGKPVTADGRMGPVTVSAANSVDGVRLLAAFKAEAERHYRQLAATDPSQAEHLAGWLARLSE